MDTNLAAVARGFYVVAALLGVPSALGTVGFSVLSLLAWWQRPAPSAAADPKASESLVNVVVVMAGWMGRILSGLLGLAEGLFHIMAALSLAGLGLAALIFFTGRGLENGAVWARLAGSVLLGFLLLAGALAALSSGLGLLRLPALALTILFGYSIWLIWRV
jgi:hypothetical protein